MSWFFHKFEFQIKWECIEHDRDDMLDWFMNRNDHLKKRYE